MIFTEELQVKVLKYIEENHETIINFLRDLVNHEGKDGEKEKLIETAYFLKDNFEAIGLKTEIIEVGGNHAPVVTGVLNPDAPSKELVFSGHYDTVFAAGSRGENPFYVKEGKAYGPGVCDMKGGIAIAFFVVKALKEFGFKGCPVRLFFVGDEEGNRMGGNTVEIIKKYTKDILVDFNMENRYESGEVCIGRKGVCEYKVAVTGVASHPGHAYDDGRNAIEEMSYKVIALQACTPKNKNREYSVNVGTIKGGTVTNGVPAYCEAYLDVRMLSMAALAECESKMIEACSKTVIDGTTTELKQMDMLIPFETTKNVLNAYNTLKSISDEINGTITGSIVVGGASDAAYISSVGAKVVCQCGITGDLTHNEGEYAIIESLYDSIRLFIFVAYNYELFK